MSKEKRKVKCPREECGYEWETKTELNSVTCPNCMNKFKIGEYKNEK